MLAGMAVLGGFFMATPTFAADCTITGADWYSNIPNSAFYSIRNLKDVGLELKLDTANCAGWSATITLKEVNATLNTEAFTSDIFLGTIAGKSTTRIPFIAGETKCDEGEYPECEIQTIITPFKDDEEGDSFILPHYISYNCKSECADTPDNAWDIGSNDSLGNIANKNLIREFTDECKVTFVELKPWTPKDAFSNDKLAGFLGPGWFSLQTRHVKDKWVTITINTQLCAGKIINVSLRGWLDISHTGFTDVDVLNDKAYTVPSSNTFSINLVAGEESCKTDILGTGLVGSDCMFHVVVSSGYLSINYSSENESKGNLNYECDGGCDSTVKWEYAGDSLNAYPAQISDPAVVLEPEKGSVVTSPECIDAQGKPIDGCYQLYSGFSGALNKTSDGLAEKFKTFTQADSIGDLINVIIQLATGIAGIIAVVMIMYEGFLYMKSDNVDLKSRTRSKIFKTVLGFLLLLCIYTFLRTLNPDLLNLTPRIDAINLDAFSRVTDPSYNDLKNIDISSITASPSDYKDPAVLAYLAHQQGWAGAASILWAANQGLVSIPDKTPFISKNGSSINKNMAGNYYGSATLTPKSFLDDWTKRVKAKKVSTIAIPDGPKNALATVASETSVDLEILTVICRIESHECSRPEVVNSGGYAGLFQLSNAEYKQKKSGVWEQYKKPNGALLDSYHNAYAGAKYAKDNLAQLNKRWKDINADW